MMHLMDEINLPLQAKIANFLHSQQGDDGSYAQYKGGADDLSCTIKAYYAGVAKEDPSIRKAV
jgi:squalene-hopene/tetraprenyl-beta-curcumene cyclase